MTEAGTPTQEETLIKETVREETEVSSKEEALPEEATDNCCTEVLGVGFSSLLPLHPSLLHLTQCCVHAGCRGKGVMRFLVKEIIKRCRRAERETEQEGLCKTVTGGRDPNEIPAGFLVLHTAIADIGRDPDGVVRRFAVPLSARATDAPKSAGMGEPIKQVEKLKLPADLELKRATQADTDELYELIRDTNRRFLLHSPVSRDTLHSALSSRYSSLYRFTLVREGSGRMVGAVREASGRMVGAVGIRVLAARNRAEGAVGRTGLCHVIAFCEDINPEVLLGTAIHTAFGDGYCGMAPRNSGLSSDPSSGYEEESRCDLLLVNECYCLGPLLEADPRFVDMGRVGADNRVYLRSSQGLKPDGKELFMLEKWGMTLFD